MDEKDQIYLRHITEAAQKILGYAGNLKREELFVDSMRTDAIVRELEIIGEAAKNLSVLARQKYPDVPWIDIISTRNILIHHYFGINEDIIWQTIKHDLPLLLQQLSK